MPASQKLEFTVPRAPWTMTHLHIILEQVSYDSTP